MDKKQEQTLIKCKNLCDYLKILQSSMLDRLYACPATCLAVFRELPETAKLFIMRMLYLDVGVPQPVVKSWLQLSHTKLYEETSVILFSLRLWVTTTLSGGLPGLVINQVFKKNLRAALNGGGGTWFITANPEPDPKPRDTQFLDEYSLQRWNSVLHYVAGVTQSKEAGISADAVRILLHAGLMTKPEKGDPEVTKDGFQFLLMDTNSQVWYFMLQYLDTVESRGMDLVQCLSFLFQLSFVTLGRDYCTQTMNEGLGTFMQHLREFGLIYQRKRKDGRFYPTRLAFSVIPGSSFQRFELENQNYLIVDNNYRVSAYTSSELQIALISLFCEPMYRLPNAQMAVITRESVREALKHGITAAQIISFVRSHAHPEVLKEGETLHPVVADQIRLWEMERERFSFNDGVLYNQFLSVADFEVLRNYAKEIGVLVWQSEQRRTIIVTKEGHDEVKKFWKRHNKER